jgi:hypothetical protein
MPIGDHLPHLGWYTHGPMQRGVHRSTHIRRLVDMVVSPEAQVMPAA